MVENARCITVFSVLTEFVVYSMLT